MKRDDFFKYAWENTISRHASPELLPMLLTRLGLEKKGLFPSTSLQELAQALESDAWKTRLAAVRTLRSLEPSQEVDRMLTTALGDVNKFVCMTAEHALVYQQKKFLRREGEAVILSLVSGEKDEEKEVYQQALSMQLQVYGIYPPDTITLLFCIARLYTQRHQYEKAEEFYQRALIASELMAGSDAISMYDISDSYALLLRKMHRDMEAAQLETEIEQERGPPRKPEEE